MHLTKCLYLRTSLFRYGKILNVAEKRDAAINIAKFLASGCLLNTSNAGNVFDFKYKFNDRTEDMIMTSVAGHLMDYSFPSEFNTWHTDNLMHLFDSPLRKQCNANMLKIKKTLEMLIKECEMLIIWTDCDREGENIGMEIVDICSAVNPNIIIKRAKFSEITETSVKRAINNLVGMNIKLCQAVDVRQQLDLKSGAVFTRLQTVLLKKKFPKVFKKDIISYGSCQFPTLGFVVERYKEIENFHPKDFWKIVLIHNNNSKNIKFSWNRINSFDEQLVKTFKESITNGGSLACVINITKKPSIKLRPVAMDTIEMIKLSSTKLKIDPKITMSIAEKLYNKGYISYPRTETTIFPKEMDLKVHTEVQVSDKRWGDFTRNLLLNGIEPRNGEKFDKAHPPIHPLKADDSLSGNEAKLFELITRHFLSCLSKDAIGYETKVVIDCIGKALNFNKWLPFGDKLQPSGLGEIFSISGLMISEKSFLEIYPYEKWSEKEIPVYNLGDTFSPQSLVIEKGVTKPPSFLTDADLISLMNKHGIGTDATCAEHIDTVKRRNYVCTIKSGTSRLVPGKIGMGLIKSYDLMGVNLSKPNLRSDFEADLVCICEGSKQPNDVLNFHLNEYKSVLDKVNNNLDKFEEGIKQYLNIGSKLENAMPVEFEFMKKGDKNCNWFSDTNSTEDSLIEDSDQGNKPRHVKSIATSSKVLKKDKVQKSKPETNDCKKRSVIRRCSLCKTPGHTSRTCPQSVIAK